MQDQRPLPPGWAAFTSPSGHPYFHNSTTGESTWHHPSYAVPHPPSGGYPPSAPPLPPSTAPQTYPASSATSAPVPTGYPGSSTSKPNQYPSGYPNSVSSAGVTSTAIGKYVYNQPVEYKLKEKLWSLSGDSFSVTQVSTGATAFKIKGTVLGFNDKKKILDPSGAPIYTMVESLLSLRGRMQISDSSTKEALVTLRKKGFIPMMGTGKILIWKGGTDEGEPWMQIKGDFLRKNFDFKEKATGRTLASVRRKSLTLSNILSEKDTYIIRVEAGVDTALFVFLVISIDEMYRDDGNRTGLESRLGL